MQYLLLIGAILILVIILFIVIFLIIRELLHRSQQQRAQRHVGFRMIRNQAEFDEFRRGIYVPRPPVVRSAPDSGIDETYTSPSSGEVYQWSASSRGSDSVQSPYGEAALDMSRRLKTVSFADSITFSRIDYDQTCNSLPGLEDSRRLRDSAEPKLTSYTSSTHSFRERVPKAKPVKPVRRTLPDKNPVMEESHMLDGPEETVPKSDGPVTSL
ncbi:uncharacterized protein [Haliotis asinina]|uniref:uncharacterized protein n=1 Tax=Haliotis asinina TaxID=109174 RepID=UPI0035320B96